MRTEALIELARQAGLRHQPEFVDAPAPELRYALAAFAQADFARRHGAWSALWANCFEATQCRLTPDAREQALYLVVPLTALTEAPMRALFKQIRIVEQHLQ